MFSLTQGGNYGQLISMIVMVIGFTKNPAEAEAVSTAVMITVGLITYGISWIATFIGRYRKGDITPLGFRK